MQLTRTLINKLKRVKLIVSDVDGVLTDGKIYLDGSTEESKAFSAKDAIPMEMAMRSGLKIVWFTGRKCQAVIRRSQEITGVKLLFKGDLYWRRQNLFSQLIKVYKIKPAEILYIGDDLNDLFFMRQAGVAVTPQNGSVENKKVADIITRANGGEGVMAEVIRMVLGTQGTWERQQKAYATQFLF